MLKFLKSLDMYGHPIGVLYKGDTRHRTWLGCVCSILTMLFILLFASQALLAMATKTSQNEFTR